MRFIRWVTNLDERGALVGITDLLQQLLTYTTLNHLPCDLISQSFAWNDGYLLTYSLVGVEVVREPRVILLNNDPRSLLHRLRAYATLRDGQEELTHCSLGGGDYCMSKIRRDTAQKRLPSWKQRDGRKGHVRGGITMTSRPPPPALRECLRQHYAK